MDFLDLPAELIKYICSFMTAESLSCFSQTCKQLSEITKIDSLWQVLSYQVKHRIKTTAGSFTGSLYDYQVNSIKGWNLSYRDIYTKVLHKLPGILGLKRLALVPYGGLVNVCWTEGEIQVTRYFPQLEQAASTKLLCQPLFTLQWNESLQEIEVLCVQCPSGSRPAILAQAGKYPLLQCADEDCHVAHTLKELHHGQSDKQFKCDFDEHPDVFHNFSLDKGFNCPLLPVAMPTSSDQARSPIKLGLYTGNYGGHGIEILNFMINQTNPLHLDGLKMTGDVNVPAGNISVTVFLDKPVVLSEGDQESIAEMLKADEQRTEESFARLLNVNNSNPGLQRQPFIVSEEFFDSDLEAPNTCMARYLGIGRIANVMYESAAHCKCHFIKFSDVLFGVMWLELSSFTLFYKVDIDYHLES